MYELAHPWLLILLPAPLLVRWLVPAYRRRQDAVRMPFFAQVAQVSGQEPQEGAVTIKRGHVATFVGVLAWILAVLAAAAPQRIEPPIEKTLAARDMMLAVDLSGSMETEDFTNDAGDRVTRLEAVKGVVGDFIERREADRIGLIVFGNAPYIQAPFSQDHDIVRFLLDQTTVRMAGPQTMMGDAIGFAITRFDETASRERVLILLTDGNDTGSKMPPDKAADIAKGYDITIHTIAVGDPTAAGEEKLDEALLQDIATVTGGKFFQANDREELDGIYRELDAITPAEVNTLSYRPRTPLFHWPLGAAALLIFGHAVYAFSRTTRRRRRLAHA